jgi:hypothetical protein
MQVFGKTPPLLVFHLSYAVLTFIILNLNPSVAASSRSYFRFNCQRVHLGGTALPILHVNSYTSRDMGGPFGWQISSKFLREVSDYSLRLFRVSSPYTDQRITLYVFFWVIPRRLNFICRRFGTLCLFHLHRQVGVKNYPEENIHHSQHGESLKSENTSFDNPVWRLDAGGKWVLQLCGWFFCDIYANMVTGPQESEENVYLLCKQIGRPTYM